MTAHDGCLSSSPLKTATSVTVSESASLSGAMSAYIGKYCEVATGNRVVFQGMHTFAMQNGGWYRFKCTSCQDNWNMKTELFANMNSAPKELTDWLDKHKHVCQSFTTVEYATNPRCSVCNWGWNQHKAGQPFYDIETNQWHAPTPPDSWAYLPSKSPLPILFVKGENLVPYKVRTTGVRDCVVCGAVAVAGSGICDVCYNAAKKVHATKALTVALSQGRMFRTDVRKEVQCELQKPISPTNSPDSVSSTTSASQD